MTSKKTIFTIHAIKGINPEVFPITGTMTIRGLKGKTVKPMKYNACMCWACNEAIKTGEQYFWCKGEVRGKFCLGCVEYELV